MHTLRRLLGFISNGLDLDDETTTISALKDILDHFKRYPKEYMEMFK